MGCRRLKPELQHQTVHILEKAATHGLERRFACYDSHDANGLLHPDPGDLVYSRGDVIHLLELCNDPWALDCQDYD